MTRLVLPAVRILLFVLTALGPMGAIEAARAQPADRAPADRVLVVSADAEDYLIGAAGTLAGLVLDGYQITVVQLGNDEKQSAGLSPAETRWANVQEGKAAGEYLGVDDWVFLDLKSGELGYVSSTEIRKQLFGLIRHLRPKKIFIPDPYVHFQSDWDVYFSGRVAEESWGYSGGATFAPELARMGLEPYSVPEVFYYPVGRPYRPREGGERNARLRATDITGAIEAKRTALAMLRTRNRQRAVAAKRRLQAAGRELKPFEMFDDGSVQRFVRAWVDELGAAIGRKHGYRFGEEFNYVGPGPEIPPHALERAVAK